MKLELDLSLDAPHWGGLPELSRRLGDFGVEIRSTSIQLNRYPESVEYDAIADAMTDIKERGAPRTFFLSFSGRRDGRELIVRLHRSSTIHGTRFMRLTVQGEGARALADSIMDLLGLRIAEPPPETIQRERSVFIAHRFDQPSTDMADRLARFLELLGFRVASGRAFSPTTVSEKVKARLEAQELVVVLLTAGEDKTWLIQESLLAAVRDKPLIIIRQQDVEFKPGLLGDLEYIPFTPPTVESSFIPLLEGLRELGFEFSDEAP